MQHEFKASDTLTLRFEITETRGYSSDLLGEAYWTFPFSKIMDKFPLASAGNLIQHSKIMGEIITPLAPSWKMDGSEAETTDVAIALVCALVAESETPVRGADGIERAREHVTLDIQWEGPDAFWLFHDLDHAKHDFQCDLVMRHGKSFAEVGMTHGPGPLPVENEERANVNGARAALEAGLPLAQVLATLATLREPFFERFKEKSEALEKTVEAQSNSAEVVDRAKYWREFVADATLDLFREYQCPSDREAKGFVEDRTLHSLDMGAVDFAALAALGLDPDGYLDDIPSDEDAGAVLGLSALSALHCHIEDKVGTALIHVLERAEALEDMENAKVAKSEAEDDLMHIDWGNEILSILQAAEAKKITV